MNAFLRTYRRESDDKVPGDLDDEDVSAAEVSIRRCGGGLYRQSHSLVNV